MITETHNGGKEKPKPPEKEGKSDEMILISRDEAVEMVRTIDALKRKLKRFL
jgi:hypothetical protein